MKKHSSAKTKMILGIIFTSIAFFLEIISFSLLSSWYTEEEGLVFLVLSLPFWGVGLPFLIIGIVKLAKSNAQISKLRAQETQAAYQQPVYQQPVAQQPVNPTAPLNFVDIDWQKYSPLEGGISFNPNKNYDFHRVDGFVGSVPQKFVDRTFPKCPICCTKEPHWTIAQHNQMSWKGNLYLFKCSCCGGIISMSMPDVTTLGNGASGIVSNPTVGLTNLMAKASSGKEVGAVYAVIESVGNSGVNPVVAGKEFKLEDLQDMYLRM